MTGPLATMILADQGRRRGQGRAGPAATSSAASAADGRGTTAYFANLNRSKRSIVVDVRQPDGRDLVRAPGRRRRRVHRELPARRHRAPRPRPRRAPRRPSGARLRLDHRLRAHRSAHRHPGVRPRGAGPVRHRRPPGRSQRGARARPPGHRRQGDRATPSPRRSRRRCWPAPGPGSGRGSRCPCWTWP